MIRYFYCSCFLVLSMGLPVFAKNKSVDYPTPSTSSKAGNKSIPLASVNKAKPAAQQKKEIVVTQDVFRGAVTPSLAARQEAVAAAEIKASEMPERHPAIAKHPAIDRHPVVAKTVQIRNSTIVAVSSSPIPVRTSLGPVVTNSGSVNTQSESRLARVTAYWAAEGDYYTERCISSTGVRLHDGHCAVDPSIIPYGSVVDIAGVGKYLAVDTGSAVISRTAAREGGHTAAERHAIVIDIFFEDRSDGERFAADAAKYTTVTWWTPDSMGVDAKAARSLFADENWTKIQSKQL